VTNKKDKKKYNLNIDNNNTINQNTCIKYSGVLIDDSLSWKPHINKISSKLASGCWILLHLRKYLDSKTLKMVYYISFINSHLNYCINSWGSASASALLPIERLQKKVVRIITYSDSRTHSKPMYSELQLLKLNDMYSANWK